MLGGGGGGNKDFPLKDITLFWTWPFLTEDINRLERKMAF